MNIITINPENLSLNQLFLPIKVKGVIRKMKKYIFLTLIFMVFSLCGGKNSSQITTNENQTTQNLQNEDINTYENVTPKEKETNQPNNQEPS